MLSSRFALKAGLGLSLTACLSFSAHAQFSLLDNETPWQETTAVAPPALSGKTPIPLESPPGSELRFGIDPDSISIVDGQVVRYTVMMQGPSARTVVYEGIRCSTAEKRVYARQNGGASEWVLTEETWQPLSQSASSAYAKELMRYGLCLGNGTNRSVRDIVRDLRSNRGSGQLYQ